MLFALGEDENYEAITEEDLTTWVEHFEISHPVLADPHWAETDVYDLDGNEASHVLLAPGAILMAVDAIITETDIEAVLPKAYP